MTINIDYIHKILNYEDIESGLYIVPTPIGNLGDITLRSLKVLYCVDLIICEDTRVSRKLTSKYNIKTSLMPFHKFNSKKVIPKIIEKLKNSKSIALISDSGTPIISDPGSDLIRESSVQDINIFSLPGPSASIASYVTSNFATSTFSFKGFFPRQMKEILNIINYIQRNESPTIFFESPNSYTGEDVLEIHSHGGKLIPSLILKETLKHKAKLSKIEKPILCLVPEYSSPGFPKPTTRNFIIL